MNNPWRDGNLFPDPALKPPTSSGAAAHAPRKRHASGRTRLYVAASVAVLAVGGLVLWLTQGHDETPMGEPPVIAAADGAIKERPVDPGGIDIPHQDVTIFDQIAKDGNAAPKTEHLLPEAEQPDTEAVAVPPSEPVVEVEPSAAAPAATETPTAAPAESAANSVAATANDADAPVPTVKAETSKPESVAAQAVAGKGPRIQLAAFPDQAKAKAEAQRLQKKYASQLGGVMLQVNRADLGAKGVYYRIQSPPLVDGQAKKICAALQAAKAVCAVKKD